MRMTVTTLPYTRASFFCECVRLNIVIVGVCMTVSLSKYKCVSVDWM